jgi:hypothetical protein
MKQRLTLNAAASIADDLGKWRVRITPLEVRA